MSKTSKFKKLTLILLPVSVFFLIGIFLWIKTPQRVTDQITIPENFDLLSYKEKLEIFTKQADNDPGAAWQFLKGKYIQNQQTVDDVHSFAHIVGNSAYKKLGIKGLVICDEAFSFGCFHGITENMLLTQGRDIIIEIEKTCTDTFSGRIDYLSGCIHGTGHGLLGSYNFDIESALKDCEKFSQNNQNYCYDGVFMEYSEHPEIYSGKQNEFIKICSDSSKSYSQNCARYVFAVFGYLTNWSTSEIAELCGQISYKSVSDECFVGLGYFAVFNSKADFSKILEICNQSPTDVGQSFCIIGSVRQVISQKYLDYINLSKKLCDKAKTNFEKCQTEII